MRLRIVVVLAILVIVPTSASAGCEEWVASFAGYEASLEQILPGEPPESEMNAISRAIDLRRREDMAGVVREIENLKQRESRLDELTPPPELRKLHRLKSVYMDSVIAAVAAVKTRDLPYDRLRDEEVVFLLPTRRCFETLLDYYRELLRLMELHGCHEDDIEALRDREIPGIQALLTEQFTGDRGR